MGYYAVGSGDIILKEDTPENVLNEIIDFARDIFSNVNYSKEYGLDVFVDDKYHEDDMYEFFAKIKDYTEKGQIHYSGEDDCQWKFVFADGDWKEIGSRTVYDDEPAICLSENDKGEFLGQLIDQIQDVLDDQENRGWPHGALIIGEFYDDLKDKLESVLKGWKIL